MADALRFGRGGFARDPADSRPKHDQRGWEGRGVSRAATPEPAVQEADLPPVHPAVPPPGIAPHRDQVDDERAGLALVVRIVRAPGAREGIIRVCEEPRARGALGCRAHVQREAEFLASGAAKSTAGIAHSARTEQGGLLRSGHRAGRGHGRHTKPARERLRYDQSRRRSVHGHHGDHARGPDRSSVSAHDWRV